jgi:hypothetical protein
MYNQKLHDMQMQTLNSREVSRKKILSQKELANKIQNNLN